MRMSWRRGIAVALALLALAVVPALAQLIDRTMAPNAANSGIAKSFAEQIGGGHGDVNTPGTSMYIMKRDPFRAIRRGRQIFQRKFTREQGQGPLEGDGAGDVGTTLIIGAGLADSCAACHGRPRGSAGAGGDVATRPDSRDAPHLFGLGLKEMLADEITADLRAIRARAVDDARRFNQTITRNLTSKGISYGQIIARSSGAVDTSRVQGVNTDLRVRPFFLHGDTISIREFLVGAFNAEMGLEAADPLLEAASGGPDSSGGARMTTPTGMVLDGTRDRIEAPPVRDDQEDHDGDGVRNEIPESIVDFMEFYLLHYFKPARGEVNNDTGTGRSLFINSLASGGAGCARCHLIDLTINRDRRVADVETKFSVAPLPPGNPFNRLFATAAPRLVEVPNSGTPSIKEPSLTSFLVHLIGTDFKRHDLGPNFHETNYDGTVRTHFLTTALWGVGDTAPYGHDGRSMNLKDVILRHGGEAQAERNRFAAMSVTQQRQIVMFLESLVLFPPDDTASNLDPGNPAAAGYPRLAHGSIRLGALFNDPNDPE
jgi:hypothetical protein